MKQTAVVYSPKYFRHKTGIDHPEIPSRIKVIMRELKKSGLLKHKNCSIVDPEYVRLKDLELVHERNYIQKLKHFCACGGGF